MGLLAESSTRGGNYNSTCPYCGRESLRACVAEHYANVPLGRNKYWAAEGEQVANEIIRIHCGACNVEVPLSYYFREEEAASL